MELPVSVIVMIRFPGDHVNHENDPSPEKLTVSSQPMQPVPLRYKRVEVPLMGYDRSDLSSATLITDFIPRFLKALVISPLIENAWCSKLDSPESLMEVSLERLAVSQEWSFVISSLLGDEDDQDTSEDSKVINLPAHIPMLFETDGFAVFRCVLTKDLVDLLNDRLEQVLRGHFDRGQCPDKMPKILQPLRSKDSNGSQGPTGKATPPLGFTGNTQKAKVIQVINIHKSDEHFRRLACHSRLGKVVAELAGWSSTRLAQDQIWAKPPGAPPLSFHRDSPYFMFEPSDVVTVWIALDDMDQEIGPLEYVKGSHMWGDGRVGSSQQFFQPEGGRCLLESAAQAHGVTIDEIDSRIISMAGLPAGSISIHNGRTWHGSGKNCSKNRPRRGLGLHYVPGHVKFTDAARKSRLWRPYVERASSNNMTVPEDDFPLVWTRNVTQKKP